jgi:UDP-N-acetylmuramoyl-L-alanyl-D-glutamate--2,6-diaminopimelate ligase
MTDATLASLFVGFPLSFQPANPPDIPVTGIAIDNRKVEPGELFVAMKGGSADGHDFIPDAIARSAAAVVGDRDLTGLTVPYVRVENSRRALTWLAAAFYGHPGKRLTVVGVTGTDGKTTTCNLLYQIMLAAGLKAGLISTVNAVIGDEVLDTGFHVTTPDAPDVQRYLARMVAAGLTHVILETTSHGIVLPKRACSNSWRRQLLNRRATRAWLCSIATIRPTNILTASLPGLRPATV